MSDAEKLVIFNTIKELKTEIKRLEKLLESVKDEEKTQNVEIVEQITIDEIIVEKENVTKKKEEAEKKLTDILKLEVEKFSKTSVKIEKHLQSIKASLTLELKVEETNVSESLVSLTSEIAEFEQFSIQLSEEIAEFRREVESDEIKLSSKEIKKKTKEFKDKLRDLKREQVVKYNRRIDLVNKMILQFKSELDLDEELMKRIQGIELLSLCSITINDWRQNSYLSLLNYAKLIEVSLQLEELGKKIEENKQRDSILFWDFILDDLRDKINDLEVRLSFDLDDEDMLKAYSDLEIISTSLVAFETELEKFKETITKEEYEKYHNIYVGLLKSYMSLQNRLKVMNKDVVRTKVVEETSEYDKLSCDLVNLEGFVLNYCFRVDSLYGLVFSSALNIFEAELYSLEDKMNIIQNKIEIARKDGLLDDNQYQNLTDRINRMGESLKDTSLRLKDPKMFGIVGADIFAFLNGNIDGLELAVENLAKQLDALEAPVTDKKMRKNIDAIFKKIEVEIKEIEKHFETCKELDEEKCQSLQERLDNLKKKVDTLGKGYRRKCPLRVKSVKSAKHFFKKYKKPLLITAGLVSFAMLAHSVIIPAIMHGNIMVASFSPALRGPIKAFNNLLGGLIGATKDGQGFWYLANGVRLNSTVASSSLLKGLAISGIGNAALVAPVIVAVKKLIEKMNMAELKQKLSDGKEKLLENAKKKAPKAYEKVKHGKEKTVAYFKEVKEAWTNPDWSMVDDKGKGSR